MSDTDKTHGDFGLSSQIASVTLVCTWQFGVATGNCV